MTMVVTKSPHDTGIHGYIDRNKDTFGVYKLCYCGRNEITS